MGGTRSTVSVTLPGRSRLPITVTREIRVRWDIPSNGLGWAFGPRRIMGHGGTRPYRFMVPMRVLEQMRAFPEPLYFASGASSDTQISSLPLCM